MCSRPDPRSSLHVTLAGLAAGTLCLLATTAWATPAATLDLMAEDVLWVRPHGQPGHRFDLPAGTHQRLRDLAVDLRRGRDTGDEPVRLGAALLGPAEDLLSPSDRWEVRARPDISGLSALVAPWDKEGWPLLEHVTLWYHDGETAAGNVPPPPRLQGGGVLAVAPFTPGLTPARDDPDTLLLALRRVTRSVELVPRNDTTAATLSGAMRESRLGVLLVRGQPGQVAPLASVLVAGPPVILWTQPGNGEDAHDQGRDIATRWGQAGRSVLYQNNANDETRLAQAVAVLVTALKEGQDSAEALRKARRWLRAQPGSTARDWAGWLALGRPVQVEIDGLGWLQRWMQRLRGAR